MTTIKSTPKIEVVKVLLSQWLMRTFQEQLKRRSILRRGLSVSLENIKRVYSWVGEETNLMLIYSGNGSEAMKFKVHHNARMGHEKDIFLEYSSETKWLRVCQKLSEPKSGDLKWVPIDKSVYGYDENWKRGNWKVVGSELRNSHYTFWCSAYANLGTGKFIRSVTPHSTREQRESKLFAPRVEGDNSDDLEGQPIFYKKMKKQ